MRMPSFRHAGCLFLAGIGCLVTGCKPPAPQPFEIQGQPIEDKDLSAIVVGPNGVGILAADEGATIQTVRLSDGTRAGRISGNIPLDPEDPEADFEGAAAMDGWFYVTGSHGVAKKKGEYQEPRARVYRFQLTDTDSEPTSVQQTTLTPLLEKSEVLAPFHKKPLQARGINIEGLAARDGDLYFGFRAPNLDGNAFVLRVNADALFADPDTAEGRLYRLPVGPGLGIRAIESYGDGFLFIAGNAGSEPSKRHPEALDFDKNRPSELFYWNGGEKPPVRLMTLPPNGKGKEEGLLVLPAKDGAPREMLVVYDGIAGGGTVRLPIPSIP